MMEKLLDTKYEDLEKKLENEVIGETKDFLNKYELYLKSLKFEPITENIKSEMKEDINKDK